MTVLKRWLCGILLTACVLPLQAQPPEYTVVDGEYFFDSDPGPGSGFPIALDSGDETTLVQSIPVAALQPNLPHRLYLRYRDSQGRWSAAEGRPFFVTPPVPTGTPLITQAETYFDTDPGLGNGEPIALSADASVLVVSMHGVQNLGLGSHRFYLRYRTNGNTWSAAESREVYVTPALAPADNHIAGGEVFLDSPGSYGEGLPIIAEDGAFDGSNEALRRIFLAANISLGWHQAFTRVRDARGLWSSMARDSFELVVAQDIRVVAAPNSSGQVRLNWTSFLSTREYHVQFDSVVTGPFNNYVTVPAPDTVLVISTPNPTRRYYRVMAILPDPDLRGENALREPPTKGTLEDAAFRERHSQAAGRHPENRRAVEK